MKSVAMRSRGFLVPAIFVALAALLTSAYGTGTMLNDGQASLHIDPLKFLTELFHAWNPELYLGTHTGFWFPYETPYAWAYGLAQAVHFSQEITQRLVVFVVYLGCLASMHYCLRAVAPRMHPAARIAGSCAYLFNVYVALNSQAQIVWLLTYGALPALVGVVARVMRGEINALRASLGIALLVLVGAGINPPLVGINVVVLALFVAVMVGFNRHPLGAAKRILPFAIVASIATVTINLYWLVPFADYFRGVWLGGVLSESAAMHNADTSFSNVLRGLGHWAIFAGFDGRAYFPWAAAYATGLFSALLWFVPIVALGGMAFKRNQRPAALFFLLVAIVSVPLVVGYYHDTLGDAITTPVYDVLYRQIPGFQMFRFSYKWVAGVEFAICALYAFSADGILVSLRRLRWVFPAAAAALVVLPVAIMIPVLRAKTNYPAPVIPNWEYRESALVGNDQRQRVALFPTQYLEQFDWGEPQFYIEDSFVDRPMIYGLLGSEPSEGTDRWVRGAYRATRQGLPAARDFFRVLGVDTILQRDDFISAIDFSSPGQWVFNSTTLTHDLLHRVLGAKPLRSEGPLRAYRLAGALPLLYGVVHPRLTGFPVFSDAYLGDVHAMARGAAEFHMPGRPPEDFPKTLESLSPILPETPGQLRDLAVGQALADGGIRVHPPSADVTSTMPFVVKSSGRYAVFAHEQAMLSYKPPPRSLQVDAAVLPVQTSGSAWSEYGYVDFAAGDHAVSSGYPDPDLIVALVKVSDLDTWVNRFAALQRALPGNLSSTRFVYALKTRVTIARSGEYRLRTTANVALGTDGVMKARVRRGRRYASTFFDASPALRYIPGAGVAGTHAVRLPQWWYRNDPSAYRWGRGDPTPWLLAARDAHLRVFVPGPRDILARASLRISRLQVSPVMHVRVDGRLERNVVLPGPAADEQAYDGSDALEGPLPVPVDFTLVLHPGWNDLSLGFDPLAGETLEFGNDAIAAAIAPDLSFAPIAAAGRNSSASKADAAFRAFALTPPPKGVAGEPQLEGTVVGTGAARVWLGVALADRGHVAYRVFPIAEDGDFSIDFIPAFPNGWNDQSKRIVGMWLISHGTPPAFASLRYYVHALPYRNLLHPRSSKRLPVRVDGKPLRGSPVFLAAGQHLVESGDRQVEIGRLTIEPASLPNTRPFAVEWRRHSPVLLDVNVKNALAPFLLVFGEAYHPEWHASLDGKPLTHVVVDGVANGWIVPAPARSPQTIVLSFAAQRYYVASALISLAALIVLVLLAYATPWGRRRAGDP